MDMSFYIHVVKTYMYSNYLVGCVCVHSINVHNLSHAHTHSLTDRPQEAEEAYRTALFHKPDHINGNTNMAHLCRLQGRWREARDYFMIALQRRPRTPTLHYYAGLASEELGSSQDLQVNSVVIGLIHWVSG